MIMLKIFLLSLLPAIIALSQPIQHIETFKFLSRDLLMQKVRILSSPEFDGRLSGSEGYNRASGYVKDHFEKLNLKPAFGNNYYQQLFVEYNQINPPAEFSLFENNKVKKSFVPGADYAFRGFTGSGNFTAPVVFCGYGISGINYNDYSDIDVNGKIVVVFKQQPGWKTEGMEWGNGYPREKANTAFESGAIGLLLVSKPLDKSPQPVIGSLMHGGGEQLIDFPQLEISIETANIFLEGSGYSLKDLQTIIDSTHKPFSITTNKSAVLNVNAEYYKEKETQNIAAILEGSDEYLKNEFIVLGAHLDHVGSQAGEIMFPGANDNASGSAAVMQIAEAFVKSGIRTKRSIIFTLFASEEQGLFGSEYFVENFPYNLNNVKAMVNMDCIGYGDSIQIGNGLSSPELWHIFNSIDSADKNLMIERTWEGGGADATPFYKKGIPSAYVVSYYSYKHLHMPSDTPETLNGELLENITALTFKSLIEIANR